MTWRRQTFSVLIDSDKRLNLRVRNMATYVFKLEEDRSNWQNNFISGGKLVTNRGR
jgi:hypothetical protein